MSKWEWDRKSIRDYREKHEPYSNFEGMMMDLFNRPFSVALNRWPNRFDKDNTCLECGKGKVKREETNLPSGLKVLVLQCSNPDCCFFERFLFTDEGDVLDFTHEPKTKETKHRKLSREEIEKKAQEFMRAMRKKKE